MSLIIVYFAEIYFISSFNYKEIYDKKQIREEGR